MPKPLQSLAVALARLPGIGPRQAQRGAFYLLRHPETKDELMDALRTFGETIRLCMLCRRSADAHNLSKEDVCGMCTDQKRDATLLCVVEEDIDLEQLEASRAYHGMYFVLGGRITPRGGSWLKNERVKELTQLAEARKTELKEIILGLNPSTEGDFGAFTLQAALKPFGIKISRLGRGLPLGGEIEYADEETLKAALEHRE